MLRILGALLLLAGAAAAEPFKTYQVMDNQGFKKPLVAFSIDIPQSWTAKGEVVWVKPCSGNDNFETVFTARSPDGRTGYRIMPGHQVIWLEPVVQGLEPYLAQMMIAQMEAERNKMRTQFRNSNCHVAQVTGTDQLFNTLVAADRPAGMQITKVTQNDTMLNQYRAMFTDQAGMQIFYDSRLYQMTYPLGGRPIEETLSFSWYMFQLSAPGGGPSTFSQTAVVDQMQLGWLSPDRRAADEAILKQVVGSIKVGPEWDAAIAKFYRDLSKDRKQAQDERRVVEQQRADERHRAFLEMLVGPN